jgi:hypothetical protein
LKVIAAKNWAIFAGHLKPPKVILFLTGTFIFGGQIPLKIGHHRRRVGLIFDDPEPPKNALFPIGNQGA